MARQRFYHDPARKHIETYQDFSGGLNTMASNDNISDTELIEIVNADLGERGSITRRQGFKSELIPGIEEGYPQMLSRMHRIYSPYNLIGVDGAFSGQLDRTGDVMKIGSWSSASTTTSDDIFKIDAEESGDLIINGGFEDGMTGWNLNNYGKVLKTNLAYSGENVLVLDKPKGETYAYRNQYQTKWHNTKEGEQYVLETMYRIAPSSVQPNRLHCIAWYELANGTRSTVTFSVGTGSFTTEWKRLRGYLTMPKDCVKVCFGIGMHHSKATDYAAVYVDNFFVRKETAGVKNSAVGMRARVGHKSRYRGLRITIDGLKPNTKYAFVVGYRTDGKGIGKLGVLDSKYRISTFGDLLYYKDLSTSPTEWTTQVLPFKTHDKMYEAMMYVYNYDLMDAESVVYYKEARVYEIKNDDEYEELMAMSSTELEDKYPFRVGVLRTETISDTIAAINGNFYVNGEVMPVEGGYPIQNERIMESVAYGDYLFIASGSGLLVYNGSSIAKVDPYLPSPLEELYIGSNALVDNQFTVSDEPQDVVEIKDIKFSQRYGVTNKFITISVGVGRPMNTTIEYKYERRNVNDKAGYWFTLYDWTPNHQVDFITDIAGEYQFKISVRKKGTTVVIEEYTIPKYIIKPTEDEKDIPIDGNTIDRCNRILLHWDRLILYGDEDKQDVIYISDLQNPGYFPVNNTLWFDNPRKERITSIVRFRDNLVVFTPSSIHALFGTNPEDFKRVMINPTIGCIADRGASVVKNYVVFPSYEGIALLKSIGMSEDRANVQLIDNNIKNLVRLDTNSVSYVRNNQYFLVYPDVNIQLRYYYDWNVWSKDESPTIDFRDVIIESEKIYALGSGGRIIIDSEDYADEGVTFPEIVTTKNFFFGEEYAMKKFREVQIMFDTPKQATPLDVEIWADNGLLKQATINLLPTEEIYKMNIAGKGLFVRVKLIHSDNKPIRLDGLGFIFKLKNP